MDKPNPPSCFNFQNLKIQKFPYFRSIQKLKYGSYRLQFATVRYSTVLKINMICSSLNFNSIHGTSYRPFWILRFKQYTHDFFNFEFHSEQFLSFKIVSWLLNLYHVQMAIYQSSLEITCVLTTLFGAKFSASAFFSAQMFVINWNRHNIVQHKALQSQLRCAEKSLIVCLTKIILTVSLMNDIR